MNKYLRNALAFKIIGEDCFIIDSFKNKAAYKLNESATSLWTFLETPKTKEEIFQYFKEEYEVLDEVDLMADLDLLLSSMIEDSLIHESK